jgi:hypothetical protein
VIELNGQSTHFGRTFAEEIRRMTGEGIETLQFDGEKIISQGRERKFIFTFVNGEKEFNFMISIYSHFFLYGFESSTLAPNVGNKIRSLDQI